MVLENPGWQFEVICQAARPDERLHQGGEWGPGFNAQNEILDAHSDKYGLQDQDWRFEKPWYKPTE
jgi:hypothetical protein